MPRNGFAPVQMRVSAALGAAFCGDSTHIQTETIYLYFAGSATVAAATSTATLIGMPLPWHLCNVRTRFKWKIVARKGER